MYDRANISYRLVNNDKYMLFVCCITGYFNLKTKCYKKYIPHFKVVSDRLLEWYLRARLTLWVFLDEEVQHVGHVHHLAPSLLVLHLNTNSSLSIQRSPFSWSTDDIFMDKHTLYCKWQVLQMKIRCKKSEGMVCFLKFPMKWLLFISCKLWKLICQIFNNWCSLDSVWYMPRKKI